MRKMMMYAVVLIAVVGALLWLSSQHIGQKGSKTIEAPTNPAPAAATTAATQTSTTTNNSTQNTTPAVEVSFIATASDGMLLKINNQGYYSLSLYNVKPYISMITERPHRDQKLVPLQEFIKLWSYGKDSLASNPPNSYLMSIYINGQLNKSSKVYVLTLSQPKYDTKRNTLNFTAKLLHTPSYLLKQVKFGHVTLTIER